MHDILNLLYNGKYVVFNQKVDENSPYAKASDKLMGLEEEIITHLPEEHKQLVDDLQNTIMEVLMLGGERDFAAGYRLGVQMMMAGLANEQ